jgi:hypothetical protein
MEGMNTDDDDAKSEEETSNDDVDSLMKRRDDVDEDDYLAEEDDRLLRFPILFLSRFALILITTTIKSMKTRQLFLLTLLHIRYTNKSLSQTQNGVDKEEREREREKERCS